MNIKEAIDFLDSQAPNPKEGLPADIFYYISRTTPLVNVDLLIKDEKGRILLAWRDDQFSGTGWHIPGGIIRYKETFEERLQKVALKELGTKVDFEPNPITVRQIIIEGRKDRSHFISFLYLCHLNSSFEINNKNLKENQPGFLKWHDKCPANIIKCHEPYRQHLI